MYPELEKAGGLVNGLNIAFGQISSLCRAIAETGFKKAPYTDAFIENDCKLSQVCIARDEKLYLADFWRNGVCLAHGASDEILNVAKAIDFWFSHNIATNELAKKFDFIEADPEAEAFDEGREVEYTWNKMLQNESKLGLHDFLKLAVNDPVLKSLFPFTSHYSLGFSRCTGYPYDSDDLPWVTPKEVAQFAIPDYKKGIMSNHQQQLTQNIFVVTKLKQEWLGEGTAEEVLNIVKNNLPDNIMPAKAGVKTND